MTCNRSRKPVHCAFTRCFAVFVAFWLWMMPQMLNARSLASVCEEFGTRPMPITEEEEVKHACAPFAWNAPGTEANGRNEDPPPADERVEVAVHGDVAVPPPKQGY